MRSASDAGLPHAAVAADAGRAAPETDRLAAPADARATIATGVAAALAYGAGVALQLQQSTLWGPRVDLALLALAVVAVALAFRCRVPARIACVGVAAFALGLAITGWRAGERLADRLPGALEGVDVIATGVVAELPRHSPAGVRIVFAVESAVDAAGQPVALPQKVSVLWFTGHDATPPPRALRGGERWQLPLRLQRPHGSFNPHGFDLELWLFERGIGATGQVRTAQVAARWLGPSSSHPVLRLRQSVADAIAARVADPRRAGVLAALVVGDQGAIDRDDWAVFRDTGVAHLMSISGLHVTMFAWLAAAAVGALWRRWPRAMLAVPAPQAARWGGLALAAAYVALSGWGVPAQRTLGMLAVVVLLRSAGLRWPGPLVLLAAALAVVVVDPWALLQAGFWLSFAAVALLMLAEPDGTGEAPLASIGARMRAALRSALRTQGVATVGLAPLTLLFFQQVSLVGFAANLVAIPVVTLALTPLALAGVLWAPLWTLAAGLLGALDPVLQALAAAPWALWRAPAAPAWAAAAGIAGAALLVWRGGPWRWRAAGALWLLPMLLPAPDPPPHGRFELVAVDVGQGTAVLLRTHRHLLVYDTGPAWTSGDAGERVLLPLLHARGERGIDALVLSHGDSDHVGGAASVLQALPVAQVIAALEPAHPVRDGPAARAVPWSDCVAGRRWEWDGVRFELLHPPAPARADTRTNSHSCVLHVQDAHGASVLLTGDLEAAQEARLALDGAAPASTAMMVPHHGSRTSSSELFLDRVAPRIAFVQAAYRSRFGHPAPEVIERYRARGAVVVRSDACGAWTWRGEGAGDCERERRRRYWHHRP